MNIIQLAVAAIEFVTATPVSSGTAVRTLGGGVFAVPSGGVVCPSSTIEDGAMAKDIASASPREIGHADGINGLAERRGGETSSSMRGASVLDADALDAKSGLGRMSTSPKTDSINIMLSASSNPDTTGRQFNELNSPSSRELETTCTGGSDEFAAGDGGRDGVLFKAVRKASQNVNKYGSPINCWKVGAVTNFEYLFFNSASFNQDVSSWNTGQATNMKGMFTGAENFNQPVSSWNTGQVTNMKGMFTGAYVFNQPVSSWNTGQVTDMSLMFYRAKNFNQELCSWGQNYNGTVNYMGMFTESGCPNQRPPLSIEGPWCYPIPSTSTSPSESPSESPSAKPSISSSAGTSNAFSLVAMMLVSAYALA